MKKIIKTLLVVMVVVLALTALTACDLSFFDKECQHSGGTATCTEKAVCEQCGESYGELLAHKEIKLPASASTCAKEGMTEGSYCKDCGTIIVAQTPVEKLDHVWVDNVDRDFTCTLDGYVGGKHCENCGIQDGTMEIIPAHHIWGETYVHTEPTCGKTGIKAHDCTVCGTKEKVEDIPATGNHNFTVEVEAKDPTCLPGYTAHLACEVCGQPNEDYTEIPGDAEDGHSFPEEGWFVYQEPTCTEAGMMAGKCEYCGKTFGLFYIDPTHVDENEDGICDVCKEEIPAEEEPECEHVWGEGEVTTAPTCTTAGVKTYTCTVEGCGATKTEDVPATGEHSFTVDVEAKAPTCEEAGYTAHKECEECGAKNDEYQVVGPHTVGEDGVCTGCGNVFVETAEELIAALEAGKNVVLTADITMDATLKCPYGNPVGVAQKGGVLDGNGHTLTVNGSGNYYAIITYGGTIKNLKINAGFRAVVTYTPTEDVVLDNVTIVGDSIGYGFNTAEHATLEGIDLVVKNSTICGWVSFDGGFESVSFENCNFVQGTYNNNVVGRLVKPYVSTTFTNCTFVKNAYLDLSALAAGETVTLVGCKVAGVDVTVDVFTTEEDHAEIPFTYEEPKGVELVLTAVEGGVSFHRHNFAIDVAGKDATCTEDGYTAHKACDCGATEGKEEILGSHADANADAKCDVCANYFLPAEGTAFVLKMYQASLDQTFYFTGAMNGYYLATGDINAAVDMYIELTEGGFHIYFMDGETKNYLYAEVSGTHNNIKFGSTKGVWNLHAETGALIIELAGNELYLGTYGTNKTFGLSKISYITGSNAANVDKTQFIGRTVVVPEHECDGEATCTKAATCSICGLVEGEKLEHAYDMENGVVTDATCTKAGYTTYTCANCPATKKVDGEDALGHTTNNGTCERCKEEISGETPSLTEKTASMSIFANKGAVDGTTISWTTNGVVFKVEKDESTTAIRTSDTSHFRAYKGSKTIISAPNMTKIEITTTGGEYLTALKDSLTAAKITYTVNGNVVTITLDSVDSISFSAVAQWRLEKIVITYAE